MTATITIEELLRFILFLLGIGVLSFLLMLLKNANNLVSRIRSLMEKNEEEIDKLIKELPKISANANLISEEVGVLLKKSSPEVTSLITNANSISGRIDRGAEIVLETIDVVGHGLGGTATTLKSNIENISDYITLIMEIIGIIKGALRKK